ncbi:MAG: LPS translocon maturation chaperone LptM [Porticoccaceae bacterium]
MLHRLSALFGTLLMLSCLNGCGNTGPLYLPQDADTNLNPETTES